MIPSSPPAQNAALQSVMNALPDFSLGLLYLLTWMFPLAIETKMVSHLILILIMEFIILHSSAFMGIIMVGGADRSKKTRWLIGLGLFYSIFVAGFSFAFGVWWPVVAFWGLMLNRLMGIFLNRAPSGQDRLLIILSWIVGIVCFLGSAVVSGVVPLPQFGITDQVIALQELDASGSWIDEPQTAMAFGFLYFTLIALYELKVRSFVAKLPQETLDRLSRPVRSSPESQP